MVIPYAYDIEAKRNLFSVTIVDIGDYLNKFKDICNENGKPIPLIKKLSVSELKDRLNNVKKWQFCITDFDSSQLLPLASFINSLYKKEENGKNIRYDLYGYNSSNYDRMMISAFLMFYRNCVNTKSLCNKLYHVSKILVSRDNQSPKIKNLLFNMRKFGLPYVDVDVMTLFGLNAATAGKDEQGNLKFYPKSLKQVSINLQWYDLLEYQSPVITENEFALYSSLKEYEGYTLDQLNEMVEEWDKFAMPEHISEMMRYNLNDVFIVCEIIRMFTDEVKLRYQISYTYGINALSSSRSNIADKLFTKFYSEFSKTNPTEWSGLKTFRVKFDFNDIIFPNIAFKSKQMKDFLSKLKKIKIVDKSEFNDKIKIGDTTYILGIGGLHSKDYPRILRSTNEYSYVHIDANSFYPSIIDCYGICPEHLSKDAFNKLIHWLKETRIQAKHSKEGTINGIPSDIIAGVFKIVINSIYGKLGYENGGLYDLEAMMKVTINGQLFLLMLCEMLELSNIEVVSANTDGIIVKVFNSDSSLLKDIVGEWENLTGLTTDSETYDIYINRDINNFCIKEKSGKTYSKGALNETMHLVDLSKGYNAPIVAKAICNYFILNKPVLETFNECKDIVDFCKTQNIGRQYHVEFTKGNCTRLQRNVRFYVSNNGGTIEKVNNYTNSRGNLCANNLVTVLNTIDDIPIEFRNVNYSYYHKEAYKIIDQIMLGISSKQKSDVKGRSGKVLLKKLHGFYNTLFD